MNNLRKALIVCSITLLAFFQGNAQQSPTNGKEPPIGTITYSYISMPRSLEDDLNHCVNSGVSFVELQGQIEEFAGMKMDHLPELPEGTVLTSEQKKQRKAEAEKIAKARKKWRMNPPMERFRQARKMFEDKGITIALVKIVEPWWSDEEIDYAFEMAKVMGASGVSFEVSDEAAQRMAPFAEKHKMYAVMHNHDQSRDPNFDYAKILSYGKYLMLNFDIGHYYGCTGDNPVHVIRRFHDRIFSIHIKDKTGPTHQTPDTNCEFGKGETPIREVLKEIKENNYPINLDIELEYPIPTGSDAEKEVKRCIDYCRAIWKSI